MSDFFAHDPDAGPLDYTIDFTSWLSTDDTVDTVEWSAVPTGLTLSDESETDGVATVRVTGGVRGYKYRLTAHVTSTAGLEDDKSVILVMGQL